MERPPKLTRQALQHWTEQHKMAETHILEDTFWMPFFLYNREIIQEMFDGDNDLYGAFIGKAKRLSLKRRHNDKRRPHHEADIMMHPHLTGKTRQVMLEALHGKYEHIRASSGGLPGLGKRR